MLRAGFEDPELERAVRTYLIGMARMSDGDLVLDGSGDKSHHREPEPEQARRPYTGHLSYRR
jgi:hypothetical protein